jgi:hypothetical protein
MVKQRLAVYEGDAGVEASQGLQSSASRPAVPTSHGSDSNLHRSNSSTRNMSVVPDNLLDAIRKGQQLRHVVGRHYFLIWRLSGANCPYKASRAGLKNGGPATPIAADSNVLAGA